MERSTFAGVSLYLSFVPVTPYFVETSTICWWNIIQIFSSEENVSRCRLYCQTKYSKKFYLTLKHCHWHPSRNGCLGELKTPSNWFKSCPFTTKNSALKILTTIPIFQKFSILIQKCTSRLYLY